MVGSRDGMGGTVFADLVDFVRCADDVIVLFKKKWKLVREQATLKRIGQR
jgi:hypothetical protein